MTTSNATSRKRLVVIDGKSVFYRGYYAMPNLSTKEGIPTGGVFGFATMALEVIRRLRPDYVVVAWDKPKTNIRRRLALYPEYKAGRKPAPPDFYEQIPVLHELLQAFGWPLYEFDDYEADDIMGTLAVQAAAKDIETILITSDMDMLQLINPLVNVYALKKGLSDIALYSPESFTEKYHVRVDQFLDLKALKGDSSDNIPGVPGIGEKGAVDLLQQYDTLDGVYENLGLIKDSLRRKLEAGKELAYLSKELADIWTDAPVTLDPAAIDGSSCDPVVLQKLLERLEFRTLARQLPDIMQVAPSSEKQAIKATGLAAKVLKPYTKLADLTALAGQKRYALQAQYADPLHRELRQLSIAGTESQGVTLTAKQLASGEVQTKLGELFATATCIAYDIKALCKSLPDLKLPLKKIYDVQVIAFLLDSLRRDQSMVGLARDYLDLELEAEPLSDTERPALELALLEKLYSVLARELKANDKLFKLYQNIEVPVIPVLAHMEREGINLDSAYLAGFSKELEDTMSDLEQQIYGHADQEFNIASPSQLAEILFTKLGLPTVGVKKGKTGYSTAASELDKLRAQHPIIDLISQYREVAKLKNTYVDTLPLLVDKTGRIHTTYNLTQTVTGRLSSTDPNLQNIPTRTDLGRRIRTAFVARPGHKLVSADYSQFELRLAAVMANDTELIDMFNRGADIHLATAAQVYERELEDVTKQMRRAAKTINFGILYGMSPHGLAIATGMNRDQAVNFIDRYKGLRRPLFDYMEQIKNDARDKGYVETLFGRRRPMPDIKSGNFMIRQGAERAAINMPIQGTEADLMKLAMIHVEQKLAELGTDCQQLLQVHDSILVECADADAVAVAKLLQDTMESVYTLPVRLDVDVTTADNWGDL
jgi:DNA polymerase-1